MATIKVDIEPTLIENTTMQQSVSDGVNGAYWITPNSGYVLHDNRLDMVEIDPITLEPTGYVVLGYYPIRRTVGADYDFDNVVQGVDGTTTVNKIGAYELYAILASEVPENQIYNIGNNDHEIM